MNPALTLAFAAAKRLPWKKVPVYWTAQVLGAFVASACVYGVYYGERKGIIWWIDCYLLSSTFVPFVGIFSNVFFLKFFSYILLPVFKLNRCLEWIWWWCSSGSWSKRHGRDLGDLSSVLLINREWLRRPGNTRDEIGFVEKFSAGTSQKVVFHLLCNRIFRKLVVNSKQPRIRL